MNSTGLTTYGRQAGKRALRSRVLATAIANATGSFNGCPDAVNFELIHLAGPHFISGKEKKKKTEFQDSHQRQSTNEKTPTSNTNIEAG